MLTGSVRWKTAAAKFRTSACVFVSFKVPSGSLASTSDIQKFLCVDSFIIVWHEVQMLIIPVFDFLLPPLTLKFVMIWFRRNSWTWRAVHSVAPFCNKSTCVLACSQWSLTHAKLNLPRHINFHRHWKTRLLPTWWDSVLLLPLHCKLKVITCDYLLGDCKDIHA